MRTLNANEIECRVGTVKKDGKGCSLLLYKDARVDMKILDEVFGSTGWQRTHEVINGNLFCNIEIWDQDKKCWVKKQDVGTESYTEKEKGQASDAFKRAGFNVGIGRELYTAPFIWIVLHTGETYDSGRKDKQGNIIYAISPKLKFFVKEIGYNDNKEINRLVIVDQSGTTRFESGSKANEQQVIEYTKLAKQLGENFDYESYKQYLIDDYNVHNVAELTNQQMDEILDKLKIMIEFYDIAKIDDLAKFKSYLMTNFNRSDLIFLTKEQIKKLIKAKKIEKPKK